MRSTPAAQIFLSGTSDLNPFKRKAQQIAEYLGRSAWMNTDHRSPGPPREVCLKQVRYCEQFFLFLGARYGKIEPELGLSPTEDEYEQARLLRKPIFIFIQDVPVSDERQIAFLDRVSGYTTGHWQWTFKSLDELKSLIENVLEVDPPRPADMAPPSAPVNTRWQRSKQRIEHLFPQAAVKIGLPGTLPIPLLDLDDLKPTPDFIGREDKLQQIVAGLSRNISTNIYAVHGLGGVGKSELAKQVALRMQRANMFTDGAIWVRLTTDQGTAAWDQIAKTFEIDLSILDDATEKLAILKEILHAASPLIILDNADDPESLAIACQPLDGKTLLITSRQRVGAAQVIDLEDLPPDQTEELYWTIYTQQLGSDCDPWSRENYRPTLREIGERLGGHPLSIEIIASKAGFRSWSPEESLADLRSHGIRALVREPGSRLFADARHDNVMKIMSLAVEDLRVPGGANYQGRTLFAFCGALCSGYFYFEELEEVLRRYLKLYESQSQEIAQKNQRAGVAADPIRQILGWDPEIAEPLPKPDIRGVNEVRQLLSGNPPLKIVFDRLVTLRVVTRHGSRGNHRDRFRLHPLLRDYAWSIMDEHLSPNIWKAVASWTAAKVWSLSGGLGDEVDNVRFFLNNVCRERTLPDEYLTVLSVVLPALRAEGLWSAALEILEAGAAWLRTWGGHKAALAQTLQNLGDLLVRKGDRTGGRQHLEKARDLYVELGERSQVAWTSYLLSSLIHERAPCEQFAMKARNLRYALENGLLDAAAAEARSISDLLDFWRESDTVWMLHRMRLRRALTSNFAYNLDFALLALGILPRERGDFQFAAQVLAWVRSLLDLQPEAGSHHDLLEKEFILFLWTGALEAAEGALQQFASSAEQLDRKASDSQSLSAFTAWLHLERGDPEAAAAVLLSSGVESANEAHELSAVILLTCGLLQPELVQDRALDAAVSCLSEASRIETSTASYAVQTGLIAADRILRKRESDTVALSDYLRALRRLGEIGSVRHRWLACLETRVVDQVGLAQLWSLTEQPTLSPPVSVLPCDLPHLVRSERDGRLMRLVPAGLCVHNDERLGRPEAVWLPPFYMDVAPVGRHDFLAFLTASGQPHPEGWLVNEDGQEGRLATSVTYAEAVAWCTWAGKVLPNVYELQRAATLEMDDAARVPWLGPLTPTEIGPAIERVLDTLRKKREAQSAPYAANASPSRATAPPPRPSPAGPLPPGVTLAQVLGFEQPSEQAEHLVELLATSLFLTSAEKEQILTVALDREVIDQVTWLLENERPALDELDTSKDPRLQALVDLRAREWRILLSRRLGQKPVDVVDPEEQVTFDRRDPFAFAPQFETTLSNGLDLQECLGEELNPEQQSAALFFLERLAATAALSRDQKRSVLTALKLGDRGSNEVMSAWQAISAERSRAAGPVLFSQTLVALQKAWQEWREISIDFEKIASGPGKLFAGQQSLFSPKVDPWVVNPYHDPRRWDEPLREAGNPAALLAAHPLLSFDEHHFLNLLSQSISLSKVEKWRILKATERLRQEQIDSLIQILAEERKKFSEIPGTGWQQLMGLYEKHWSEWIEILAESLGTQAVTGEVEASSDFLADGDGRENDVNISNLDYSLLDGPLPPEYAGNPFAQQPPCDGFLSPDVDIRAMIPAHPQTYFSERRFLQLLSGSVSLTGEEKLRIVQAVPKLIQKQLDGLVTIFLEERRRFLELAPELWTSLDALCKENWCYWPELALNLLPVTPELARSSDALFQRLDGSLWHWTSSTDSKGEVRWIAGGPEMRGTKDPGRFSLRKETGGSETRSKIRVFRGVVPIFSYDDLRDLVPVLDGEQPGTPG